MTGDTPKMETTPQEQADDVVRVVMTRSLMERMVTRSEDGRRIRVDWGEPDADGFYTPTLTVDFEDDLGIAGLRAAADLLAKFPGLLSHRTDLILWEHARKRLLGIK